MKRVEIVVSIPGVDTTSASGSKRVFRNKEAPQNTSAPGGEGHSKALSELILYHLDEIERGLEDLGYVKVQ